MFWRFGGNRKKLDEILARSKDFKIHNYVNEKTKVHFQLTYISTIVDDQVLQNAVLPNLLQKDLYRIEDAKEILPNEIVLSTDPRDITDQLLNGHVMLTIDKEPGRYCFISARKELTRDMTVPEVEFSVSGPKSAFIESMDKNINLIRQRLPIRELVFEQFEVGRLSKTKLVIIYIEGITNRENVETIRQRIQNIEVDMITDSSYINQIISDNVNSPFPQLLDTERPDRVCSGLAEGKVAIIVDGSPHALLAPTTLIEFFSSFEDYFMNWILATFFRFLRFFSVSFSIFITPIYVAVLTYHYELIPQDLIGILETSRRTIPFPPILEALFLELTIELLREAGARLPTKVGQTIGIVGGIVIGTASVEAGLTSNVLLILVALAALASFTTPVFRIGNTIRLLRFPFLIAADIGGLLGISYVFCLLLAHLIRLTSIGRPYLEPLYPFRLRDFRDALIRLPFEKQSRMPIFLRPEKKRRFSQRKAVKKKDIDE